MQALREAFVRNCYCIPRLLFFFVFVFYANYSMVDVDALITHDRTVFIFYFRKQIWTFELPSKLYMYIEYKLENKQNILYKFIYSKNTDFF